ncbi:beta-xylosidase [Gallibacterium salpingitidis]|uniref:Beta-xylosidase n=1 Tax=Gallibacterium salpingitidis TaxID=505341 RepID=A0AB36E0C8_9PAST|nr:glycoside hydrolase family 43 protein [Gallibacterium salpingitidis]OBX07984.1 beta-xylosidase [Gallibacterium salpingitidis]OBX08469.1 beta-xylosidase [Gallibacterium salpingitidis]
MKIKNPILTGFHPDPSIIRVDDTYYIANSTFEWFPGVRLHQSKDLLNWELLPSPLSTKTLLDMKGNPSSGGIWAPDLSYADGKFWLVYTDVKVTEGAFKDMTNYLTTAENILGPWSDPIKLNGVGFDASLFHDDDGRKYLVQQTWDHREYKHPFNGITLTEFDTATMKLKPQTARTIYTGTDVKLVEGPHLYKINGYYYLFAAEGGTVYTHQEVVARSKTLDAYSFETDPDVAFITNFDTPKFELQKQGHGALVNTLEGEWYYASLCGRPWHHSTESITDPRGWCTLGRETSLQKVYWNDNGWPKVEGGTGGQIYIDLPQGVTAQTKSTVNDQFDDFTSSELSPNWNTLRVPFSDYFGDVGNGKLSLIGRGSLANTHEVSMIARRWQHFYFEAETKVKFDPFSYQQMAGLTNFYNDRHWSFVFITYDEQKGRVIEVAENNRGQYRSLLQENAIQVPDNIEYIWLKTIVEKQFYYYEYSFDGQQYTRIPVKLDAKILSDDYVLQSYGGFFTGAFIGLACIDYSGYELTAEFTHFRYRENINQQK